MPQEFYYPVSSATASLPYDGLNNGGGANKNASCRPGGGRPGPMTHDDAATYVAMPTGGFGPNYQSFNMDWPSPMVTYDGVLTLGFRHSSDEVYFVQRRCGMAKAGPTLGTARHDTGLSGGGWATSGPSDISVGATYRPGGGSWVLADFDGTTSTFVTVWMNTGDTNATGFCTSVWGEISFTPPSGGFGFLLNLVGASALPFVGSLIDFASFRKYLDWREVHHPRHTKWRDGEDLLAWLDVKNYRWPSYHFMEAYGG